MQKEMIKSLKAINFDLDSKALQKIYQSDNPFIYLKAYKQINKFFTDNGFVHRQWSGYISKGKLFDYEIINLIDDMNTTFPWLRKCVKKFYVTDIGEQHDLIYIFQKPEKSKLQSKSVETKENGTNGKAPISCKQIKNNAKIIAQKNTVNEEKQTDKSR